VRCPSEALDSGDGVEAVTPGPAAVAGGAINIVIMSVRERPEMRVFQTTLNELYIFFLFRRDKKHHIFE
jgi:hypothetical protein